MLWNVAKEVAENCSSHKDAGKAPHSLTIRYTRVLRKFGGRYPGEGAKAPEAQLRGSCGPKRYIRFPAPGD